MPCTARSPVGPVRSAPAPMTCSRAMPSVPRENAAHEPVRCRAPISPPPLTGGAAVHACGAGNVPNRQSAMSPSGKTSTRLRGFTVGHLHEKEPHHARRSQVGILEGPQADRRLGEARRPAGGLSVPGGHRRRPVLRPARRDRRLAPAVDQRQGQLLGRQPHVGRSSKTLRYHACEQAFRSHRGKRTAWLAWRRRTDGKS